jgi:2-haloacid dehalogenase
VTPRAVVFDMYGTLLRMVSVAARAAEVGLQAPDAFVAAWRRKQIEYSFLCSIAGDYRDFDELTRLALQHTIAQFGVGLSEGERAALMDAWQTLPVYPDVEPALRALRERAIGTAVLTNGTGRSANRVLQRAGVRDLLDDVLSVEAVRVYKPDPRVYSLATERFACSPDQLVFVSSNGWDAWGASSFGLRTAWCNRAGVAAETLSPPPTVRLGGLDELEAFVAG